MVSHRHRRLLSTRAANRRTRTATHSRPTFHSNVRATQSGLSRLPPRRLLVNATCRRHHTCTSISLRRRRWHQARPARAHAIYTTMMTYTDLDRRLRSRLVPIRRPAATEPSGVTRKVPCRRRRRAAWCKRILLKKFFLLAFKVGRLRLYGCILCDCGCYCLGSSDAYPSAEALSLFPDTVWSTQCKPTVVYCVLVDYNGLISWCCWFLRGLGVTVGVVTGTRFGCNRSCVYVHGFLFLFVLTFIHLAGLLCWFCCWAVCLSVF